MRRLMALAVAALGLAGCASSPSTNDSGRYAAIVAAPDRSPADRAADERRKPVQMLAFTGVKPGMTVEDLSAARGYNAELLARAVMPGGKVYAQNPPRDAARRPPPQPEGAASPPPMSGPMAVAPMRMPSLDQRTQEPSMASVLEPVTRPFEDPVPPLVVGRLDVVTLLFNYHDFGHWGVDRAKANRAIFDALKPGGVYVIADHAGRPGTGISESGTLHRVEEAFVVAEVEAAGFKLVARGDFLQNPADPRDRNTPEPPMAKDDFVLRFVKPS